MNAIISPCQRYRYRLDRELQQFGRVIAFFGVNPSTADATEDDQTIRKMTGFALRHSASRLLVGNVFAWRATDVKALAGADDPVGRDNAYHLGDLIAAADWLVPCWGDRAKLPSALHGHVDRLKRRILQSGKTVKTLGFTLGGDPRHPLMLGYDIELKTWRPYA